MLSSLIVMVQMYCRLTRLVAHAAVPFMKKIPRVPHVPQVYEHTVHEAGMVSTCNC
jgi:hypothetical protein